KSSIETLASMALLEFLAASARAGIVSSHFGGLPLLRRGGRLIARTVDQVLFAQLPAPGFFTLSLPGLLLLRAHRFEEEQEPDRFFFNSGAKVLEHFETLFLVFQ